jgi:hypothetical protein
MAKKARKKTGHVHKAKKSKNKGRSAVRVVQPNYWGRVKRELHLLICTNDKKYAALRKHLGKEDNTTQVAIISSISLTVAAYIGAAAAIVGPLVTLGLLALLQVGKNAWCAGEIT